MIDLDFVCIFLRRATTLNGFVELNAGPFRSRQRVLTFFEGISWLELTERLSKIWHCKLWRHERFVSSAQVKSSLLILCTVVLQADFLPTLSILFPLIYDPSFSVIHEITSIFRLVKYKLLIGIHCSWISYITPESDVLFSPEVRKCNYSHKSLPLTSE